MIQESYRSTKKGVKNFVEPAAGTLIRVMSKTHNIVFGRRGSGKSSLLRKAAADLTVDRRPIAYIDLETFKRHSYPDVLLSVLIQTFKEFEKWLRTAAINPANKTSFWKDLFGKAPERPAFNKKQVETLANKLEEKIEELDNLLNSSDRIDIQRIQKSEAQIVAEAKLKGGLATPFAEVNSEVSGKDSSLTSEQIQETFQSNKIDFLYRHILEYQEIFAQMSELSGGDSYLFLDDLYYIKRTDQAKVIDYFHGIAKGNNLWLKIGTVRHRTTWYQPGDPTFGLKLGDDVLDINLDLTLENYSTTKEFLVKVLQAFVIESGLRDIKKILAPAALDKLVLASGGVARDFLGLLDRSIAVAKERGGDYRGNRVGREDVHIAAGKYQSTKMDEFRTDILSDEEHLNLENAFKRIKMFCINKSKTNLFLYEPLQERGYAIIQELMDLRLVHKVNSHLTVSKRQGKVFENYMLDVSAYSEMRKKRGFEEIMFWQKGTNVRLTGLILEESYLLSKEPIYEQENVDEKVSKETNTVKIIKPPKIEQMLLFTNKKDNKS
jgi:hypothetical protein